MSTEQQSAVSFNPDDASGLFDNARAIISKVVVDYFTAQRGKNAGQKYVNVDVTYKPQGGGADIIEHYMLGPAEQWAPNAQKTGAVPVTPGGKIWNKSDAYRIVKSLVDAGFPKERVGTDLSVFVGTDVHVNRVTQEGAATYVDDSGKTRTRTSLLVTKIYALPGVKGAGTAIPAAKVTKAAAAPSTTASEPTTDEHDAYVSEVLLGILADAKEPIPVEKLAAPAFMRITRDRKSAIRGAVQKRIASPEFLGTLAEGGVIQYDGATVAAA